MKNGNYFWAFNLKITLDVEVVDLDSTSADQSRTSVMSTDRDKLRVRWTVLAGIRKDSYENLWSIDQLQKIFNKKKQLVQGFFANLDDPKHQR